MKKYILFCLFFSIFHALTFAQQTDENTLVINRYFQSTGVEDEMIPKETDNLLKPVSYVNLIQNGDGNAAQILNVQEGDSQSVLQTGNSNNYEFFGNTQSDASKIAVKQSGNFNSLLMFGENTLMQNISIFQKSDFGSIIIRNYKN